MNDPIQIAQFLNDKYANVCSDKCKLINALETIGRECRITQKEITYLLDLLGECLTDKELLLITNSDDEFVEDRIFDASVDMDLIKTNSGKVKQLSSSLRTSEKVKTKTKTKSQAKSLKAEAKHVILPVKQAIERFGEPHEVFNNKVFTTEKTEGCTALMGSKLQLMGLDLDGKVDGVYEPVEEGQVLVVENHPNLTVFLKEGACKIWKIDDFEFEDVVLSKCITEHYLKEPTLDALNEKFAESSTVSLVGFLQKHVLESINIAETVRIGPADYRSFAVLKQVDTVSKLLVSVAFRKYVEDLTGLPLSPATRPPLARVLEAAGDYQILHGNYSEPIGVDCIFNFYPNQVDGFQWPEETCGRIHYLDEEGTEILEISNASNSLTLVYRTEGVVRFLENVKGTSNQPLFQVLITYPVLE